MQPIIKSKPHKIPKWTSEHIELRQPDEGFIRSTISAMVASGRAKNALEIHHSGKRFMQFERKASLKFKKVVNAQ